MGIRTLSRHGGCQRLTGSGLKWIAVFTMLIDHIGAALLEYWLWINPEVPSALLWHRIDVICRCVGRLSFPLFCFLIVEGFCHTHDLRRYGLRLLLFAVLSEIPYDLAFTHSAFDWEAQNVFFTLFLGLTALYLLRRWQGRLLPQSLSVVICAAAAEFLHIDYGLFGVLLIILLYLLRDKPHWRTVAGCALIFLYEPLGSLRGFAAVAFLLLYLYSGEKGKGNKYFFYLFYPAHLLLLYGVSLLLS